MEGAPSNCALRDGVNNEDTVVRSGDHDTVSCVEPMSMPIDVEMDQVNVQVLAWAAEDNSRNATENQRSERKGRCIPHGAILLYGIRPIQRTLDRPPQPTFEPSNGVVCEAYGMVRPSIMGRSIYDLAGRVAALL